MKNLKIIIVAVFMAILVVGCGQNEEKLVNNDDNNVGKSTNTKASNESKETKVVTQAKADSKKEKENSYKVTFIELGSVNCIPCKMMQPVMRKVEEKYKGQVKVIFYDVWTKKDAPMAKKYGISVIPTQIFLDSNGKEYYRHEGYFPFEQLEEVLKQKGVE